MKAAREQGFVGERRKYAKFWKGFCRKDGEQNSENLQNTERGSPSARDKLLREGKLSDSSTRKTMHSLHENIHTESPGKRKIESLETIEGGNLESPCKKTRFSRKYVKTLCFWKAKEGEGQAEQLNEKPETDTADPGNLEIS